MKVFVLVPIHNRREATLNFLRSFSNQTYKDWQMVVVDDGSTDGSSESIMAEFPKTVILKGDGNLWWTGAMRMGVDYILDFANDTDYILTMNDDVTVDNDYIENLVSISRKNNDAIVGSLYKDSKERDVIYDSGVKIDWQKYRYYQIPFNKKRRLIKKLDTLATRGTLVPVSVFKKIGSFEKRLRHYAADYEYFFRAKKYGYKLLMSRDAVVYGSEKEITTKDLSRVQPFITIWKRSFGIKSATNIYNHLFIIWHYCPSFFLKTKISFILIFYNGFLFFNSIILYPFKFILKGGKVNA